MIANFFNKTKPVTTFSIAFLLFIYYFTVSITDNSLEITVIFLLKRGIFFLLLILFLLIVKFIIDKNRLTKDNSYALLLVVLLLGSFSEAFFSYQIVFSNLILLLSFRKVYSLRSDINTKMKLFDAAFWVGISTLIYAWSIFYMLLIYVGILMYQKLSLKNLLIPLIGFLTPVFIYFTYCFYIDETLYFYNRFSLNTNFEVYNSLKFLVPIIFLVIMLVWSIVIVTPRIVLVSNKLKSSWSVLINHLLISFIVVILAPIKNGAELLFTIVPSTIIITNFVQGIKSKIIKNVLLYLFLIISVSVYFL